MVVLFPKIMRQNLLKFTHNVMIKMAEITKLMSYK